MLLDGFVNTLMGFSTGLLDFC